MEVEKVARTFAMVGVQVGEADHVEIVPLELAQVGPNLFGEVATQIVAVLGVALVAEVNQDFAAIGQVNSRAIGVAERKDGNQCRHKASLWLRGDSAGDLLVCLRTERERARKIPVPNPSLPSIADDPNVQLYLTLCVCQVM